MTFCPPPDSSCVMRWIIFSKRCNNKHPLEIFVDICRTTSKFVFQDFQRKPERKKGNFQIWKRVFDDKTSRAEIQSRSWRHSLDTPAVYIARDINYYSNSAKAQRIHNIRNKVFDNFRENPKNCFCFYLLKEMKIFLLLLLEPRGEGIFTYTWVQVCVVVDECFMARRRVCIRRRGRQNNQCASSVVV